MCDDPSWLLMCVGEGEEGGGHQQPPSVSFG